MRLAARVERHLPCNRPSTVREFGAMMDKVVGNILASPTDPKFRELRALNKTVLRSIINCHGGREMLHLLGFERISKYGEPVYFLSDPQVDHLTEARVWLAQRVEGCLSMATQRSAPTGGGNDSCADCVITVKLTSGRVLEGGFFAHETIKNVYEFLHASVVNSSEDLRLCHGSPPQQLGEDMLGVTLKETNFMPTATLEVVKTKSLQALGKAVPGAVDEATKAAEDLNMLMRHRDTTRREKEKEKAKLVAEFLADHEGKVANTHPSRHATRYGVNDDIGGYEGEGSGFFYCLHCKVVH
ncbi:unnamed protein product [Choristocarpus tenellus]